MKPMTDIESGAKTISNRILRFRKSERLLHWALAVPFLVCLVTAIVLFGYYNPDPTRPYRVVFGTVHRVAGIALIVLPILAILISKGDVKTHFYNVRQAWFWRLDDIKWLLLMGPAALNKKITLPEQGKFNAAEKLNLMYLMISYPLYIVSGYYIWETEAAFIAWGTHVIVAAFSLPLITGHIFMATVNASSRVGLSGMLSGYVDREWAKHHYGKWFRDMFGDDSKVIPIDSARKIKTLIHTEEIVSNSLQGHQDTCSDTNTFFSEDEIDQMLNNLDKTG